MNNTFNGFSEFSAFYQDSSAFPQEAINQIPKSLISAIDDGNEVFFKPLKEKFPLTYSVLSFDCSRISLLENVSMGMGLDDFGEEYKTYWWGLTCGEKLITIEIPVNEPDDVVTQSISKKYFASIPTEFSAFYKNMGGIAIASNVGPQGYDLPASFAHWRELNNYCDDLEIQSWKPALVYDKFPDGDIRVFIRCSDDNIVICNLVEDGKRKLFYVETENFENVKLIENPVAVLDTYFSEALKGSASLKNIMGSH